MSADILDSIWNQAINIDPEGRWIDSAANATGPFSKVAPILSRLLAAGASREDLGRLGRAQRYEACFGTLYALDDPGPGRLKLAGLHECVDECLAPRKRGPAFIKALRENIETLADAESIQDDIRRCEQRPDKPFADVGGALRRLMACGATPEDFGLLASWHRAEACRITLRLVEEGGFEKPGEAAGLHESLLGADPSEKDGRPGSWPLPESRRGSQGDAAKPFLKFKGEGGIVFTPDAKAVLVGDELRDLESGEVLRTFEVKGEIWSWEFSRDHKRIYYGVGENGFVVCDFQSGRQLQKIQRRKAGSTNWFLVDPQSGDLLVLDGRPTGMIYSVLDSMTLDVLRTVDLTPGSWSKHFAFSPDGSRLAGFWGKPGVGTCLTVWRWPELDVAMEVPVPCLLSWAVTWSADGRRVAVGFEEVAVFDAVTGAAQLRLKPCETSNQVAFSPDGKFLATGAHWGDRVQIWDASNGRLVRELPLALKGCYGVSFSPDGRILGVLCHRASCFWRF